MGLLVQWLGFKNFSRSLKSCQKVERVRSDNSAGLGSAGVLLRGVIASLEISAEGCDNKPFKTNFLLAIAM